MKHRGLQVQLQANMDASAAGSIRSKQRAGKVRHFGARELWIQDWAARKGWTVREGHVSGNLADILSEPGAGVVLDKHIDRASF